MKLKFNQIYESKKSLDFLKNKKIVSIIKNSYDKNIHDIAEEWTIFSNSKLLNDIVDELYKLVKEKWVKYDYIASLGLNGAPLTYVMGAKYDKKILFIDDEWGVTCFFQKIKPDNKELKNSNILLISPFFESGLRACRGIDILAEKTKIKKVDVLATTFFPMYVDKKLVKDKKYENSDFYYLYHWDPEIAEKLNLLL